MYFHYRKSVDGDITNIPLVSILGHRGFNFHLSVFDSCGEKGKVGSELICLFVEKLLSFKKSMRLRAKRSLKEQSRDALRKQLIFIPLFSKIFLSF